MGASIPIPPPFDTGAFAVSDAIGSGVGRGRLQGRDLARPFYGVRSLNRELDRIHAAVPRLRPGDRFSSVSGARLLGAPLPFWLDDRVHITAGPGLRMPRVRGIVGHEADGRAITTLNRLPVSTPDEVFVSLAGILPLRDLVAVGDFLVLDPRRFESGRPWATIEQISDAVSEVGRRGIRQARNAADLIRPGVESPKETDLRLELHWAGLPPPICGYEVFSRAGQWIGWFDLAWPEFGVLGEYDGDQHRTSTRQYDRDLRRVDAVQDDGWKHLRVRSSGLGTGAPATIDRFRNALRAGGWRG